MALRISWVGSLPTESDIWMQISLRGSFRLLYSGLWPFFADLSSSSSPRQIQPKQDGSRKERKPLLFWELRRTRQGLMKRPLSGIKSKRLWLILGSGWLTFSRWRTQFPMYASMIFYLIWAARADIFQGGISAFAPLLVNGFGFNKFESTLLGMPSGAAQVLALWISGYVFIRVFSTHTNFRSPLPVFWLLKSEEFDISLWLVDFWLHYWARSWYILYQNPIVLADLCESSCWIFKKSQTNQSQWLLPSNWLQRHVCHIYQPSSVQCSRTNEENSLRLIILYQVSDT